MRTRFITTTFLAATVLAGCGGSESEPSAQKTVSVDPATAKGACSLLVGPTETFVDDALAAGKEIADGDAEVGNNDAALVQNSLFKIVTESPTKLSDPAGQLVDYLDDPAGHTTDGVVDESVLDAVESIKVQCAAV